jgi:hypothetical protein
MRKIFSILILALALSLSVYGGGHTPITGFSGNTPAGDATGHTPITGADGDTSTGGDEDCVPDEECESERGVLFKIGETIFEIFGIG